MREKLKENISRKSEGSILEDELPLITKMQCIETFSRKQSRHWQKHFYNQGCKGSQADLMGGMEK